MTCKATPKLIRLGTIATMEEYARSIDEYSKLIRSAAHRRELPVEKRIAEELTLNRMLATLYEMQQKFERKTKPNEEGAAEPPEEEKVEITKGHHVQAPAAEEKKTLPEMEEFFSEEKNG